MQWPETTLALTRPLVAIVFLGVAGVASAQSPGDTAPSHDCAEAIIDFDGHVVAFEPQPLNLNSGPGHAEDFVFRAWPPDATPEQSQLIRVRYVWSEDGEAPTDDLRRADRTWHITVTRSRRCDANIDDLLNRQLIFEDGRSAPLSPYFEPAPGIRAEAIPPGTSLSCYVLKSNDAR